MEKYRAYELLHARWAMLAAAGIIIPEGLQVRDARWTVMLACTWLCVVSYWTRIGCARPRLLTPATSMRKVCD